VSGGRGTLKQELAQAFDLSGIIQKKEKHFHLKDCQKKQAFTNAAFTEGHRSVGEKREEEKKSKGARKWTQEKEPDSKLSPKFFPPKHLQRW